MADLLPVNGHVESRYSVKTGRWTEPQFVEDPFLRIHGMAPGLNYGQQCYEGMKAFRSPSNDINIFRPVQNAERMQHSASYISIPPVPSHHFIKCIHLAVGLNAAYVPPHETGAAMYIRPLLFGSSAQLGLNPPEEYTFCVYVLPTGVYHGTHPVDALILEQFDRAAPEGTGSAKVGGNYAPVTMVVPDSKNVIKSVTADSVCEIAKSLGWKVEARPIPYEELPSFSEVMAAGTAAALVPIKSITMESKGDKFVYRDGSDEPGPACVKLLNTLKGIQQGKITDTFGWLSKVHEPIGCSNGSTTNKDALDGDHTVGRLP